MITVVRDPTGLWRVQNAPVVGTGIEYPIFVGGKVTFTEDHLAAAVAALRDPAIVSPRIKLGHTSDYNLALVGDAEMAFGRVEGSSMYIGDNGQTIYGDYLVPEWLGKVMAIAFPNRSMEGNFDVETATGKKYGMVINAVSLLGIHWPGCQVLEDLPMWYGGDIPDGVEFDDLIAAQIAASSGGTVQLPGRNKSIKADADTSQIRRQFYNLAMSGDLAGLPDGTNTYWWWIRGERIGDSGDLYLIVEDEDNGDLYKFGVTVAGEDVTFSEPNPVQIQYVEKTAASIAAAVQGMASMDDQLAVYASSAETGGPNRTNKEGASHMDDATRKKLAASAGLPETATEAEINTKLQQRALAANPASGAGGNEPDNAGKTGAEVTPEDEKEIGQHQTPPGTAPSGTGNPDPNPVETTDEETHTNLTEEQQRQNEADAQAGVVRVDKATWERTQSDAALARKHENERVSARQQGEVDKAIKAGKIPPSRRDHYVKLMAADEQGTTELLGQLQASTVPLTAVGHAGNTAEGDISAGQAEGLPDQWFPDIAERRAHAAAGARPVTQAREA